MAFNPFTSFRKHQKVWMASILIVCMVTFVLCTGLGGGDLGSWLLNLFGGSRGNTIARFDGKNVTDQELSNLRVQRKLANEFMILATRRGRERSIDDIVRQMEPGRGKDMVISIAQTVLSQPESGPFLFDFMMKQLPRDLKPAQLLAVAKLQPIIQEAADKAKAEKAGQYFTGSDSDEDLFVFMLWRDEAKNQGIAELDDDGVREEVRLATHPRFSAEDWKDLETYLRKAKNFSGVTAEVLLNALRDEFRVRQFQTSALGYRPGQGLKPEVPVTLDQAWEYYKEKRSEFNVDILPIPVEAFLGQVKETPTDAELKELFNKYKNQEKDPASATPGFKQSRRVQVAWITGDPASPFYKGMGAFIAQMTRATFPLGWLARLQQEYDDKKSDYKLPSWTEEGFVLPFYLAGEESTVEQAQKTAALAGQALSLGVSSQGLGIGPQTWSATLIGAFYGPALVRASTQASIKQAVEKERVKRAGALASLVLAGVNPVPIFPGVPPTVIPQSGLMKLASSRGSFAQYLPFELIREGLVKKFEEKHIENRARALLNENVAAVEKEINRFKPAEKEMEVRARKVTEKMKEAAAKYHLILGETTRPSDKFSIADDPALKPLKEAFAKEGRSARGSFADLFFPSTGAAERFVPRPLGQIFAESPNTPFLYWTTEDQPAKVLESFESIRDEVVKQWKLQRARKLARARAEEVVRAIDKAGDDVKRADLLEAQVKSLRDAKILKEDERTIPLFDVAPLKLQPSMQPDMLRRQTYSSFKVPPGLFTFPRSDDWAKMLLAMGTTGPKVQILDNQPETIIYVAVRVKTPEARVPSFLDSYRNRDDLWTRWNRRYAKDLYDGKVEELKKTKHFEDLRSKDARQRAKEKRETPEPVPED
jgi:hypothetical protein